MKEIKTATIGIVSLEASFTNGVLESLAVSIGEETNEIGGLVLNSGASLPLEDLPKLVEWLQTTVLQKTIPDKVQKVLDTQPDPMAQRRVINPALSGVQVFDNSDKLSKANVVKFTVPKKD